LSPALASYAGNLRGDVTPSSSIVRPAAVFVIAIGRILPGGSIIIGSGNRNSYYCRCKQRTREY